MRLFYPGLFFLRNTRLIFLLSSLIIFWTTSEILAQNDRIDGQLIYSSTEKGVAGALIYSPEFPEVKATTDEEGRFNLFLNETQETQQIVKAVIRLLDMTEYDIQLVNKVEFQKILVNLPQNDIPTESEILEKLSDSSQDNRFSTPDSALTVSPKQDSAISKGIDTQTNDTSLNQEASPGNTSSALDRLAPPEEIDVNDLNARELLQEYRNEIKRLTDQIEEEKENIVRGSRDIRERILDLIKKLANLEELSPEQRDTLSKDVEELELVISDYSAASDQSKEDIREAFEQVKILFNQQTYQLALSRTTILVLLSIIVGLSGLTYVFYQINKNTQKQKAILAENIVKINQQKEEINIQKEKISAQRDDIEQKKQELESTYTQVRDSVFYAQRIQNAILVHNTGFDKFFRESFLFHIPRDIVSGDFYWMADLGEDLIVSVVDCTGHGVPGAFMTILAHDLLNQIVHDQHISDPAMILQELDNRVRENLRQDNEVDGTMEGMDLMLIKFNMKKMKAQIAGARSTLFFVRDQEIQQVKGAKYMIGSNKLLKPERFDIIELDLQKDDVFYLFSDGFHDQFGGEDDSKYLKQRFRQLLLSLSYLELSEQHKNLQDEFTYWKGNHPQTDDVMILGLRI